MKPMLEKILNASIDILINEGFAALNTRNIAKKVNIKPSSLYNHISRKFDVFIFISEHFFSDIIYPKKAKEPKTFLIELFNNFRKELLKYRHITSIFLEVVPDSPKYLEFYQKAMESINKMGIDKKYCFSYFNLIFNYVLMYVYDEEYFKDKFQYNETAEPALFYDKSLKEMDFDKYFVNGLEIILDGFISKKSRKHH